MNTDSEPCRICHSSEHTEAPEPSASVIGFNSACDHGMGKWNPVSDFSTMSSVHLSQGIAVIVRQVTDIIATEDRLPHCRWYFCLFENTEDEFCAIHLENGGYVLHWDPCPTAPLVFHSRMDLGQWALSHYNDVVGDMPYDIVMVHLN